MGEKSHPQENPIRPTTTRNQPTNQRNTETQVPF
jgi:hypothetical protein